MSSQCANRRAGGPIVPDRASSRPASSRRRHPSRAEPAPVCVAVPLRACPARLPSEPACLLSDICDMRSLPRIQGDVRCTQWRTRVHPTSVDNPTTGTRPQRASARISAHRLGPITSASIRRKTWDLAGNAQTLSSMIDPLNTRTASAPPEKTPDVEAADNGKRLVQRQASLNGSRPCDPLDNARALTITSLTYVVRPSVIDFPVTIYSQIYAHVPHAHSSTTTHLDVCPQPRLCPTAAADIPNSSLRPPHAARQPGTETTALACIKPLPVLQGNNDGANCRFHNASAVRLPRTRNINTTPPASPPAYLGAVILPDADGRPRRRAHPPRLPAASPHIARHPQRSGSDARVARSVPARSMLRPRVRILAFAPFADAPQPGAEGRHTAAVADTIESSRRLGAQQNTSSRALQHVYSSESTVAKPSASVCVSWVCARALPVPTPALCTTPPPPSSGLMRTPGPRPHEPRATVGGVADGARVRAQSPALGQDALPMPSRAPAAAAALLQMRLEV
ncbi:hypothetical protein POSPLADRAFT_1061881 [Postia placenta MAD-698-R-SB12]|uniref:Uncharacterized protein n=1 Tax=Postia placenta MAD-698-R-SB12 TaxID=670580 RepID=A0A1X6MLZ4_9APHY|nr:hypothetical protein POSPLADRAFT_1061881 [Postia placenta MAD-698-R-SB12]OSX57182.1 hypothetical protein POSPLADRAFT_1061881 [Postia placenta MAD-698-R-SB12]